MDGQMRLARQSLPIAAAVFVMLAALVLFVGCRRETPAAHDSPQVPAAVDQPRIEAALVQTTCPVMGGAIDKAIFTEYQGKKVYFCCRGCDQKFLEDPEKYLAKLPQFQN